MRNTLQNVSIIETVHIIDHTTARERVTHAHTQELLIMDNTENTKEKKKYMYKTKLLIKCL